MRNNRKQFIINRPLQYQIIGHVVLSGAFVCLISIGGLYLLSRRVMDALTRLDLAPDAASSVLNEFNQISTTFVALVIVSLTVSWLFALYLSSRIAGPIYNACRVLDARLAGDKSARVAVRKGDFFFDLAERINKVFDEK